jgi:hypothetical protein
VASAIGFNDVFTGGESTIEKHANHRSIQKNKEKFCNNENEFCFREVSRHCVYKKMRSLDPKKATGYDNFPVKLIRGASMELSYPVTILFNTCIRQAVFPQQMKYAELSPCFKNTDMMDKSNYRPLSILTSLSKIFEGILNDQLAEYFS